MTRAAAFKQVVDEWFALQEDIDSALGILSTASGDALDTWRKRVWLRGSDKGQLRSWRRNTTIEQVDRFLVAAGLTHLWHEQPLMGTRKKKVLRCEDCGVELGPDNYRPLDLFRHQSGSSGKFVWDNTKQKWVRRPARGPKKRARRNGRRFRVYDLCRKCAGEALRQRAASGSVMENGARRALKRKERVAPKRGGRPSLLTEDELRSAYHVYTSTTLSRREIAKRIWESKDKGTRSGYESALLYGWRRLGLELRDIGTQLGMSVHGTDGTKTKNWKQQCKAELRGGRQCGQWVRIIREETSSHPAEDGLCWNHAKSAARVPRELSILGS